MSSTALASDLDHVLAHTKSLWEELRGRRLFITGGTGFVGCWLLESFAWANDQLGLGAEALVLTRNAEAFQRKAPHLASNPALRFLRGDIRDFVFPDGEFPVVIHAVTEGSDRLNWKNPLAMLDMIVQGARRTLDFAASHGTRKLLLMSSGDVYGRQPPELTHVGEDYAGAPDPTDPRSAHGEGKRLAEFLCAAYARQYGFEAMIARGFTFVGPYLPLDIHFAIGNFIGDVLAGRPIVVKGDGTPYRSYLYAADLAIWLWTILLSGRSCRAYYNVGSEQAISIADLARTVASAVDPPAEVRIVGKPVPGRPAERYVPSTRAARMELGLEERIDLAEALRRTLAWNRRGA